MSFDDRLRDELRRATESHPIDADAELRRVKSSDTNNAPDEALVVPLVDEIEPRRNQVRTRRIIGVAAAIALLAGAVALPFALRDRPHDTARRDDARHTTPDPVRKGKGKVPLINRAALQAVTSALAATTGSGSFHVAYTLTETAGIAPTTTTCQSVAVSKPGLDGPGTASTPTATFCSGGPAQNVTTAGSATVNTNPFAMKAVSDVSNFGPVTVRVDDTDYWETVGSDSTTTPSTAGQPISSFAGLVESTLGAREGAGAMMGLANPSGYLSITREAITGAKTIGTGTIDGKPVTNYRVVVDPALLARVPGISPEQVQTIDAALVVLQREGFTGNTTDVSVDANGMIVHTKSTNNFADGGSVMSDDTFSQFGCAGAVDIPGHPVGAPTCATPTTAGQP